MFRTMMKSKIHRATVTQADLHYVGSVTVDQDLMAAADLLEGEQVAIVDITNGARLETYVIPGPRGSGVIGINGAAAHLVHPGDLVILISYAQLDEAEIMSYAPRVVFVDEHNRVAELGADPGHAPAGSGLLSGAVTREPVLTDRQERGPGVLLCIDVGNTQIALGLYSEDTGAPGTSEELVRPELVRDWRMRTDPRITADELEVAIHALLGAHAAGVTGIAALSTVPSLLRELRLLLGRRSSVPSVLVGPGVRTGVPLLVDNPREVGADRVVSTLAAHRLYGTACVVVDFGTSTNIDVVSARGEFLGGALAPGIEISLEALATRAAALRTVELVRPRAVIGKNTVECLQSGVLYGFAGQVDGLVARIVAELGVAAGPVTVLATGGLAPLMEGVSTTIVEYVPDLTLLGLRLAYLRNMRSTVVSSGSSNTPVVSGRPAR